MVILDRTSLSLSVTVVDGRTGAAIPGAEIQLQGQAAATRGAASFGGLAESKEGYDLRVRADGYFWRSEIVPLPLERSGSTLVVPLAPEYVAVEGRVELTGGSGAVTVRLTGAFPGAIEGYHSTSARFLGSGAFRLRVPRVPGPRALAIDVNDARDLRRKDFDMADPKTAPQTAVRAGAASVSVIDVGAQIVDLTRGATKDVGIVVGVLIFDTDLRFDFRSVGAEDFTDRRGASFYAKVEQLALAKSYERAGQSLDDLLQAGRVKESAAPKLRALANLLDMAGAMTAASDAYSAGNRPAAIAALAGSRVAADPRVRAKLLSLYLETARAAHEKQEYEQAAVALGHAAPLARSEDQVAAQLERVYRDWAEAAFARALGDGTWRSVDEVLRAAGLAGVESAELREFGARAARESIPPACRARYGEAVKALAAGDLETAHERFGEARAAIPNDHYRALIDRERDALATTLFEKWHAIGVEREVAGKLAEAVRAYLRAFALDPLEGGTIAALLARPEVGPEAQALKTMYETIKAGWEAQHIEARDAAAEAAADEAARRAAAEAARRPKVPLGLPGITALGKDERGFETYRNDKDGSIMVFVEGGTFQMGSENGDPDELPVHEVKLSGYYFDKYECTVGQWKKFVAATPRALLQRQRHAAPRVRDHVPGRRGAPRSARRRRGSASRTVRAPRSGRGPRRARARPLQHAPRVAGADGSRRGRAALRPLHEPPARRDRGEEAREPDGARGP